MQEDRWRGRSATSCRTRSPLTFDPLRLSLHRLQSTSNSLRHIWPIKRLRYYCYSHLWNQRCLALVEEKAWVKKLDPYISHGAFHLGQPILRVIVEWKPYKLLQLTKRQQKNPLYPLPTFYLSTLTISFQSSCQLITKSVMSLFAEWEKLPPSPHHP